MAVLRSTLLSRINENSGSFSKGQRAIAAYVTEHGDKAAFMTAAKLGETVGVSESTVVRFAGQLGLQQILITFHADSEFVQDGGVHHEADRNHEVVAVHAVVVLIRRQQLAIIRGDIGSEDIGVFVAVRLVRVRSVLDRPRRSGSRQIH